MGQQVASWIEHHAARTPDRVALVDLHRRSELTYGDLAARVRAVAWSLSVGHGVGHGRLTPEPQRPVSRFASPVSRLGRRRPLASRRSASR